MKNHTKKLLALAAIAILLIIATAQITNPSSSSGTVQPNSGSAGALAIYPAAGGSTSAGPSTDCTDSGTALTCNGSGGATFGTSGQYNMGPNGRATKYNNTSLVGIGMPYEVGSVVNLTNQTATAGPTNIQASLSATGQFEIQYYIDERTACATPGSGQVSLTFSWTDVTAARTSAAVVMPFDSASGASSFKSGNIPLFGTSATAVSYTATYTACTSGTGAYDLRVAFIEVQ